ncbi:cellulose-growth-specific protein [Plectosphaerella plurivora]|uniref:lytic cellulose monooxygenase (C4-dehydrogenating) n=1 Tax=Plectosphaerella plurivora TaxID=936078 RepID=A0A9P8VMR1_9PEZI|nr:cellulose-growth-specific protein [Plectosphaerella plurivora]
MHFFQAAALFAGTVSAHYNFERLIVDGEVTGAYEYVRKTTNGNGPITAVNSTDIICNAGGIDDEIMAATKTFTVAAGAQVGFKMNEYMGHPGPLAVYLSKAPGTAQEYKGDGEWFKVYQSSLSNKTVDPMQWAPFIGGGVHNFTFTLPEDLPAGEYLMRGEHIGLHSAGLYEAQFYIGCAQLKVTGSGAGTPGPTVQFPGAYDPTDPGILVNMYWPPLRQYTPPGPVTWPVPCDDSTVNVLNGQPNDGDCTPLEDSAAGDPVSSVEVPVAEPTTAAPAVPSATSAAAAVPTTVETSVVPIAESSVAPVAASSVAAVASSSAAPVAEATPTASVVPSPPSSCRAKRHLSRKARRATRSRFA